MGIINFLSYEEQRAIVGKSIWNVETGERAVDNIADRESNATPRLSHNGRIIATIRGVFVQLWSTETGQRIAAPLQHESNVQSVSFFPDDSKILVTCPQHDDVHL